MNQKNQQLERMLAQTPKRDQFPTELVSRIIGRGMDRDRPLWESYVIEGLPDDRFELRGYLPDVGPE